MFQGDRQLVKLSGRDALMAQFKKIGDEQGMGKDDQLRDIQPLKTYQWLLGGRAR